MQKLELRKNDIVFLGNGTYGIFKGKTRSCNHETFYSIYTYEDEQEEYKATTQFIKIERLSTLSQIIYTMQDLDKNGEWMELIDDIIENHSVNYAKECIINALTNWLEEDNKDELYLELLKATQEI